MAQPRNMARTPSVASSTIKSAKMLDSKVRSSMARPAKVMARPNKSLRNGAPNSTATASSWLPVSGSTARARAVARPVRLLRKSCGSTRRSRTASRTHRAARRRFGAHHPPKVGSRSSTPVSTSAIKAVSTSLRISQTATRIKASIIGRRSRSPGCKRTTARARRSA